MLGRRLVRLTCVRAKGVSPVVGLVILLILRFRLASVLVTLVSAVAALRRL